MESYGELLQALPNIQLHFFCELCERRYVRGWLESSRTQCLFCKTYRAAEYAPSRLEMMLDAEWVFIQSGHDDKWTFYTEYTYQLHRWADAMGIPFTSEDMAYQRMLMKSAEEDAVMTDT
jgi:hypothetical protein